MLYKEINFVSCKNHTNHRSVRAVELGYNVMKGSEYFV
jgi:hypothetical protein